MDTKKKCYLKSFMYDFENFNIASNISHTQTYTPPLRNIIIFKKNKQFNLPLNIHHFYNQKYTL